MKKYIHRETGLDPFIALLGLLRSRTTALGFSCRLRYVSIDRLSDRVDLP
jgi:hypothetical protein